jgi:putative transcriptional regulator
MIMKKIYNAYEPVEPIKVFTANDIKKIRKKMGTTQGFLAKWLGVSKKTVQAWESGRNIPNGPSARLLSLLDDGLVNADSFMTASDKI